MNSDPPVRIAGLLFADVKGYSKLNEAQLKSFLTKIIPAVAHEVVDPFRNAFVELNTWGDGIVVASLDPYKLLEFAFRLRNFYRDRYWSMDNLPKLQTRIALHAGAVYVDFDPIRQKTDAIIGTQVTKAARVEPVTEPGEIWATDSFVHLIPDGQDLPWRFDDIGPKQLAKDYGSTRLYRVRRDYEGSIAGPHVTSEKVEAAAKSSAAATTLPQTEEPSGVDHPLSQKKDRGEIHPCKFHIMSPHYLQRNRWTSLSDVLVDVKDKLPEWARDAYLIPSSRALPKLRDAKLLKSDMSLLELKRQATMKFISEWENRDLVGAWFTMPTGVGQSIGVYSLDYDLFLNASLTEKS